MNRVLKSADATPFFERASADAAQFFETASPRFLDPGDAAMLEAAVADAYERGFAEGRQTGRSEAEHAARLIDRALTEAALRAREHRNEAVHETISLGLGLADAALGDDRFLSIEGLADRITDAISTLDDTSLTISVSPEDLEPIAEHLTPPPGIDIRADRSVRSGEARIDGGWSSTEITKQSALDVIERTLS